eukprot:TRINITY_DN7016_c0_g1_i3.p1 TRINITY_DN7016_c0_g1~~TRINITY_DN7016_c0_g1_i3.p1  ORF type:complete len:668 (+),score=158.85 TRINITY_DN7016_c0_g1_i3:108-2111(+)
MKLFRAALIALCVLFVAGQDDPSIPPTPVPEETSELESEPDVVDDMAAIHQLIADGAERVAYTKLTEVAEQGNNAAREMLGLSLLLGNSTLGRNVTAAVEWFELGVSDGHPGSQWGLGFCYALGVGVNASQAKALVYYTFAALGGDSRAQMNLGYRYSAGSAVAENCETSLSYYRQVADIVEAEAQSVGAPVVERLRLNPVGKQQRTMASADVVQYYQYNADRGDVQSQVVLGQLHLNGQGVMQDNHRAVRYFQQAAGAGHADAMAFLGDMYANGLGVEQNNDTAVQWMDRAANKNSAAGRNSLGVMYLNGFGVKKDVNKAFKLFQQAATAGSPEGQLSLGTMYYNGLGTAKDYRKANHYFTLAAQQGHVLAMYNLALMHATGVGNPRSCAPAKGLFKNVAERGHWGTDLTKAFDAYQVGDYDQALMRYLILAEMGYEVAQYNAALILDTGVSEEFSLETNSTYQRALLNWRRAAQQGSQTARVKVGDYLYYGHGSTASVEAAAHEYRVAADNNHPQAMFNLGVMHHFGDGLDQDLHLAKRYYDLALSASSDAFLPTTLALYHLYALFAWEYCQEHITPALQQHLETVAKGDFDQLIEGHETALVVVLSVFLAVVLLARQLRMHQYQQMIREQQRLAEEEAQREQEQLQQQQQAQHEQENDALHPDE